MGYIKVPNLNWCRISSTNSIKVRISFRISPRITNHDRHMRVLTWGCKYTGDTCQIHSEYLNISRWTDLGVFLNGRCFHQILRHTWNYASISLAALICQCQKIQWWEASFTVIKGQFFFNKPRTKDLPSWELTYPLKSPFWRWCSFSPGGIC